MAPTDPSARKLRVVRVVTAHYVVPWHLANTLERMPADFETYVVGQGVSRYRDRYPDVQWIDLDLERKAAWFADLKALFALCRVFHTIRPDIVHSIMPKAGLLAALAGFLCRVPVRMHTFTGQVWATKQGLARHFYYLVDRLINVLNTVCLTDSPSQSAFLHEHGFSYQGEVVPVLSKGSLSGVDLVRFDKSRVSLRADELRSRLGLRRSDFVFAFIARKTRDKGAIDILSAFAKIVRTAPNLRLLFVGPDESNGEIAKMLGADKMLARAVLEVGQVDNHELYLAISDVLCLPSHREGFGTIVIDAAALGVPAIGTRIPGLVDAIEEGETGMLCPPGDVQALAASMEAMQHDPEQRLKMGEQARSRVERLFSADVLYQALRAKYFELARKAGMVMGEVR